MEERRSQSVQRALNLNYRLEGEEKGLTIMVEHFKFNGCATFITFAEKLCEQALMTYIINRTHIDRVLLPPCPAHPSRCRGRFQASARAESPPRA